MCMCMLMYESVCVCVHVGGWVCGCTRACMVLCYCFLHNRMSVCNSQKELEALKKQNQQTEKDLKESKTSNQQLSTENQNMAVSCMKQHCYNVVSSVSVSE